MNENEKLKQDLKATSGIEAVTEALKKSEEQIDLAIRMTTSEHAQLIRKLIIKSCYQEQIIKRQKELIAQKDRIIKNSKG